MGIRDRRCLFYALIVFALFSVVLFILNNNSANLIFNSDFIETPNFVPNYSSITKSHFSLTTNSVDPTCGYYVRSFYTDRLGNRLFMYASFYGMVKAQRVVANKTAFVRVENIPSSLSSLFENLSLPEKIVDDSWLESRNFTKRREALCCTYDKRATERLSCDGENVIVYGYRQSFRYFAQVFDEIKKEFTFRQSIREKCRRLFDDSLASKKLDEQKCVTVAVHLRRGDFAQNYNGWPAQLDYFQKAIRYHELAHSENDTKTIDCLAFLIFGDDHQWNVNASNRVELLRPQNSHLILIDSKKSTPEIDMCAMRLCNHTIVSVGSFGWWAGFYSRGVVTYQKQFAKVGVYHGYEPDGYFLPHWIPL